MPTIHYHNLKPKAKSSFTVRRLIGSRPPSDRIAFAVRLDCVRRLTGLRTPSVTIIKKLPYYITTQRRCTSALRTPLT